MRRSLPWASLLLLVLVVFEAGLQVQHRLGEGNWWPAAVAHNQGMIVPVADRREFTLAPDFRGPLVNTDPYGFRGRPVPADYRGQVICALGDSVPFGDAVEDDQTFPYALESRYRDLGRDLRVLNAGIPSYTVWQSLDRYLLDVLPTYRPSVVLLQSANDVSLLTQYREEWTPERTWASVRYAHQWRWTGLSGKLLGLHHFRDFIRGRKPQRVEQFQRYPPDRMLAHLQSTLDERLPAFADGKVSLILLPINFFPYVQETDDRRNANLRMWDRWHLHYLQFEEGTRLVNEMLEETAKRYDNVYFLDIHRRMDAQDRDAMFVDLGHLSPRGVTFVADELINFIKDKRLLSLDDPAGVEFERLLAEGLRFTIRRDHRAAIERYRAALQASPDHPLAPQAHNNLGWSLGQLGDHATAVKHLERATLLVPEFTLAINNLASSKKVLAGE